MLISRETKKFKTKSIIYSALALLLVFVVHANGALKETTVTVAHETNFTYYNPDVKISPTTGAVYVVYEAMDHTTGRSDVFLSKYENGSVSFVKNVSEANVRSYWPDIDITNDGKIHIVWANQSGRTVIVKYRSFDGSNWSNIISFGQLNDIDFIEDLRMAVDESGNVFAVLSRFLKPTAMKFMSKYGDKISFEELPFKAGRTKHGEVAADKDYIHMIWQYYYGGVNHITYSRRENKPGSSWQPLLDMKHNGCQRPRMSEGIDDIPQVVFARKDANARRKIFYEKWNVDKFDSLKEVSPLDRLESNNFAAIAAVDIDNVIITMQQGGSSRGKNISYNWQQNGVWTGNQAFYETTKIQPTRYGIDLKFDSLYAALAFTDREVAVYLLTAEEKGSGSNLPTAAFTMTPESGSSPLEVEFDASSSKDPGGAVKSYRWDFSDGTLVTGKKVTHTFTEEGTYDVQLTVFDNEHNYDRETGKVEVVNILPPLNVAYEILQQRGFLTWAYLGKVTWDDNPANAAGGINVVKYNIYRRLAGEAEYSYYDSVTAPGNNIYYDPLGKGQQNYQYTVTAVDDQDRESAMPQSISLTSSPPTPAKNSNEK